MTVLKAELAKLAKGMLADPIPGAPPVDFTIAPGHVDEAAAILRLQLRSRRCHVDPPSQRDR